MSSIARFVGSLMLGVVVWAYLAPLIPAGFWLPAALLPMLWNLRNAKDDGKDPLDGSEQQKADWINELELFANEGKR